jgi:hypothetical protein
LERLERVRPGLARPDLEFEPVCATVNLAERLLQAWASPSTG